MNQGCLWMLFDCEEFSGELLTGDDMAYFAGTTVSIHSPTFL